MKTSRECVKLLGLEASITELVIFKDVCGGT